MSMKQKALNWIKQDLWIVILDIIAVNAAYFLTILIRFWSNSQYRVIVDTLMNQWQQFTPFYTLACIVIFALFRLYNGTWRYAGINDMNRIILANVCTAAVQVAGTLLFVARMPLTYYGGGIILQFLFILMIRYGYRFLLMERKKMAGQRKTAVPVMVIGAGETARKAIVNLEDTPFRATIAADEKSGGKILNGVPVVADYTAELSKVRAVIIADRKLTAEKRKEIQEKCEEAGVEVQDYTGLLSNLGGLVPVSSLLSLITNPVKLVTDGQEKEYADGTEALKSLKEQYEIDNIVGATVLLKKPSSAPYMGYDTWAQQHKEHTGEDVSFF